LHTVWKKGGNIHALKE